MKISKIISSLAIGLVIGFASQAQDVKTTSTLSEKKLEKMKTYLIERDILNAGKLTPAELKGISRTSCKVLKEMDGIEWVHSYITSNKVYCIYRAKNEKLVRKHAKDGGFPITTIMEIADIINPATATGQ